MCLTAQVPEANVVPIRLSYEISTLSMALRTGSGLRKEMRHWPFPQDAQPAGASASPSPLVTGPVEPELPRSEPAAERVVSHPCPRRRPWPPSREGVLADGRNVNREMAKRSGGCTLLLGLTPRPFGERRRQEEDTRVRVNRPAPSKPPRVRPKSPARLGLNWRWLDSPWVLFREIRPL
jgi:hypothetical protein